MQQKQPLIGFTSDSKEKKIMTNPQYQTYALGDFYGHYIFAVFYKLVHKNSHWCDSNGIPDTVLYTLICKTKLGYSGCDQRKFCGYLRRIVGLLFGSNGASISIEIVQTTRISTLSRKTNNSNYAIQLSNPNIKSNNKNISDNNDHSDHINLTPQIYVRCSHNSHDKKESKYDDNAPPTERHDSVRGTSTNESLRLDEKDSKNKYFKNKHLKKVDFVVEILKATIQTLQKKTFEKENNNELKRITDERDETQCGHLKNKEETYAQYKNGVSLREKSLISPGVVLYNNNNSNSNADTIELDVAMD